MIEYIVPIYGEWNYGYRHNQWTWYGTRHRGIDISCPLSTPIHMPADGVCYIHKSFNGGNELTIIHDNGSKSYMAHISYYRIGDGQRVVQGEVIAYVGNTGFLTTGPHLHWHVYINGKIDDPSKYFTNNPINMAVKQLAEQQQKKLKDLFDGNVVVGYEVETGKFYEIKNNEKEEFEEKVLIRRLYMAAGNKATFDQIPNKK